MSVIISLSALGLFMMLWVIGYIASAAHRRASRACVLAATVESAVIVNGDRLERLELDHLPPMPRQRQLHLVSTRRMEHGQTTDPGRDLRKDPHEDTRP